MLHLLITPVILIIVSFFICNKDIVVASRYLAAVFLFDILTWNYTPSDWYYIRSAVVDVFMFLSVFFVRNNLASLGVGIACVTSFTLNIYEQISYYQTVFYSYRGYLQFALTQLMVLSLLMDCRWRDLCKKTHMRK